CVDDAALVFDAIAAGDASDTATLAWHVERVRRAPPLDVAALRIGVPRRAIADRDEFAAMMPAFASVLERLARAGATIVDPCDLPAAEQLQQVRSCVFRAEFKEALNAFLREHGSPC